MIAILTIIEVIFLIGFLIFIHEGGHYIAAKLSKVKVKELTESKRKRNEACTKGQKKG